MDSTNDEFENNPIGHTNHLCSKKSESTVALCFWDLNLTSISQSLRVSGSHGRHRGGVQSVLPQGP